MVELTVNSKEENSLDWAYVPIMSKNLASGLCRKAFVHTSIRKYTSNNYVSKMDEGLYKKILYYSACLKRIGGKKSVCGL